MKELTRHYEWLHKQNELGQEVDMSDSDATSVTEVNKCPSPESNSVIDGGSSQKKTREQHRVFTGVEKKLLEEQYKSDQLNY